METNENGLKTRPESLAAIRLLQGVIYSSDEKAWNQVLTYRSDLEDYFACLGLILMLSEDDGLAYLRQRKEAELDADGDGLPRLFRRTPLTYDMTLLCVILRDELRRFEDEDMDNTRCCVTLDQLMPMWKSMQPSKHDDVKNRDSLKSTIRKLETMSIVSKFGEEDEFEIKPILKARMPLEVLSGIRDQLKSFVDKS